MEVSPAAKELHSVLQPWRERPRGATPFIQLDALWCKSHHCGLLQDGPMLVPAGIEEDCKRTVLGVSVALGVHAIHSRDAIEQRLQMCLIGVRMITRDDHGGLHAPQKGIFRGILLHQCQFQIKQNALASILRDDIVAIINAPHIHNAVEALKQNVARPQSIPPQLSACIETAMPESLTVMRLPAGLRERLRTSDGLECVNQEDRGRFALSGSFGTHACCPLLVDGNQ